ncbi:hypothetical protein [Streptomyces lydicus]|uniref:hypothetical protein n=1 Tax=Streptomyces lydicus TaxID=47763 RepID=UPI000527ECB4|nr:hypothetical protein [Streptomyces lydicus]MDC7338930.1 hypothetical protein [Streptomyces lydicus]UEG91575.1 hypothetical protein LJ741_14045 [Streptomyces lydicus]
MRIRKSPSPAVEDSKTRSTEDLRNEYGLINRERAGGANSLGAIADQNDIARELERRGEL